MTDRKTIPAFGLYGEVQPLPDVVHCEAFSARAPLHDWQILAHRHRHLSQVFVISAGKVDVNVDGHTWSLADGTILFVPELCVHALSFEPGTEGQVLSFPSNIVAAAGHDAQEVSPLLSKPFWAGMTDPLAQLCRLLRDVAGRPSLFRSQIAIALTHAVLSMLADAHATGAASQTGFKTDRLHALDRLIAQHLSDDWSASDYASALSISTGHLSRLCRQSTGLGAAAYIEQKLMTEAMRLLAFTQLPVSEIGYRLGYADPSYFSKRFNMARGQSPSTYRAQFTR